MARQRALWTIGALRPAHDRNAFASGSEPLDRYISSQASQDVRRHIAAVLVATDGEESTAICGYYTLSAYGIDPDHLPAALAKKLPRYDRLPAILLGRLAVDRQWQGMGLGGFMLIDALSRAHRQSVRDIAAAFLVVDALDEKAASFYRHRDFIPFEDRRDRLFLPMATIAALFPEDGR